eukprot:CAMPEP_0204112980 /NCGR_PEP_ID=MMETSP0361-20130328/3383_1 /ASSEMBLY_ACC=CAM_ASM_000343 /TAXON_ID=268821 /ORGANISM="Scrippsiella Hangoei, Strain SHTV-5" /LENGTH=53 /DNA_ID=CAMNT_0051063267 /DNA_START=212 /DNA_END=369 /DNA_ORIENTATION=+
MGIHFIITVSTQPSGSKMDKSSICEIQCETVEKLLRPLSSMSVTKTELPFRPT